MSQSYLSWSAENCFEADNPDTYELYKIYLFEESGMNEQDQREASEIQEALTLIRDSSNRVINYAIAELNTELNERDSNYVKSMQRELLTGER